MSRPMLVLLTLLATLLVACSGPNSSEEVRDVLTPTVRAQGTTRSGGATATRVPTTPTASSTATAPASATLTPTSTQPTSTAPATSTPRPAATSTSVPPSATATQAPLPATATATATSTIPASQGFITISTADTEELVVALTFDAGADRGYAEEILNILLDEGVVATFGMTASWAEDNPDLIHRMVDEGHQLMNHTATHRSWTGRSTGAAALTRAERAEELRETERVIEEIAGYDLRPYFRPPYGDYDDSVIADLQTNDYSVNVMWTVDSLGWNGLSADEITARVVNGTVPGAIHLFHVGAASEDAAALPGIIAGLRAMGYRFVTVEEMVRR